MSPIEQSEPPQHAVEKPWYERHAAVVLGLLFTVLIIVIVATQRLSVDEKGPDAPLIAEGLPPGVENVVSPPPLPAPTARPPKNSSEKKADNKRSETKSGAQNSNLEGDKVVAPLNKPPPRRRVEGEPKPDLFAPIRNPPAISGRPLIVDAATLVFDKTVLCVSGIQGIPLVAAEVNQLLGSSRLTCSREPDGFYNCQFDQDGRDYAGTIVSAGLARPINFGGILGISENMARLARRGIWQMTALPPAKPCEPVN